MKKSISYWLGILLLAVIPVFVIDISEHYLSWRKDVREELIIVVHNKYEFSKAQKALILDRAFEKNQMLYLLMYTKGFLCLLCLCGGFLLLRPHRMKQGVALWKTISLSFGAMALVVSVKFLWVTQANPVDKVYILAMDGRPDSLQSFIASNFKNKVVYVDFWGTSCGPCLVEFRNFLAPLKKRYNANNDIEFLYISQGSKYLWKQQLDKYKLEGYHLFLEKDKYKAMYLSTSQKDSSQILIPRYLIVDRQGNIVESDAKPPSDQQALYAQLDKYLATND